jgi:DNA-binding winged helix-turn-helix (wHTH) protein/TolB-like protein/Flp pilus assembly protein TadD
MTAQNSSVFLFDDIRVEPSTFQVFKAGDAVSLEPKTLRLLLFLIENRGRLIEKDEILNTIWNGTNVTENALAQEIGKLRKTLRDDPKAARYIQTVHTRGYRFIAEVRLENGVLPASEQMSLGAVIDDLGNGDRQTASLSKSAARPASKRVFSLHRSWMIVAAAGITTLLLFGGFALWNRSHRTGVVSPSTPTSVAVLPFKIVANGKGDEYLGVEIADALTARLGKSKRLSVRPITSVLHYANSGQDPRTVGSDLKVDYVLYGEIDRSRQHMKTDLIRVRDGASLFAQNYDQKFDDIFQLEDSLSAQVLANLLVNLDHEETQRSRRHYTENRQAYESFLKAHYLMNKATREDTYKSVDSFREAIDLDPKYAMAYAGLSDCYMRLGRFGVAPAEFVPRSRAAVMKALELDDTVAYAHSMLGRIAFLYDWDFARAEREYARARELEPSLVHAWYASYLLSLNRVAEAEVEYRKFEDFLPFMPANIGLAQYLYLTGQYDGAIDLFTKKLEMNPSHPVSHESLGLVYEQQRRIPEAIQEFQKAIELSGGVDGVGALGHVYAISGKLRDAEQTLRKLDDLARQIYVSPYQKAVVFAGLGKKDEALKLIEKAYAERSLSATSLRFDPRLNELRGDPRFQDFLRRTGMPL